MSDFSKKAMHIGGFFAGVALICIGAQKSLSSAHVDLTTAPQAEQNFELVSTDPISQKAIISVDDERRTLSCGTLEIAANDLEAGISKVLNTHAGSADGEVREALVMAAAIIDGEKTASDYVPFERPETKILAGQVMTLKSQKDVIAAARQGANCRLQ